ncbi:ATP-binding protein [Mangrovibacterium marinum]|uniref:histidine kinase n=1 Tax=Mangrovibacterium marinum TaxID=1639118 RepID=A0A2T5BZ78_9BACT|nr:ATP-binding protein [Mangrovibacterium marinum]PTN07576.1 histidine kinase/DNA gyrase B/HSP90-like ATPase [Mangrovibacterium marinum]
MIELALHILDIAQNSIRAKARLVQILISENPDKDYYRIVVKDNGSGMDAQTLAKVTDPFYTSRTSRKVGLGIPMLKQNAEQCGGSLQIKSTPGIGTTLTATFGYHHIDRPPLGDIIGTIMILLNNEEGTDLLYRHQTLQGEFNFDSREIKRILEGTPLVTKEIRNFLKSMIEENLDQIQITKE